MLTAVKVVVIKRMSGGMAQHAYKSEVKIGTATSKELFRVTHFTDSMPNNLDKLTWKTFLKKGLLAESITL